MNRSLPWIALAAFVLLGAAAGVWQLTRHRAERPDHSQRAGAPTAVHSDPRTAPGSGPATEPPKEGPTGLGAPKETVPAVAGAHGRVEGTVHTVDGRPAAAVVSVSSIAPGVPSLSAHCAEDGTFAMEVPIGTWVVRAEMPGQVSNPVYIAADESQPSHVDLVLQAAGAVAGTVTDPDGRAVAGASVTATLITAEQAMSEGEGGKTLAGTFGMGTTDAQGRYRIAVLPGTQTMKAEMAGFGPAFGQATVAVGTESQVDLQLAHSLRIAGRVTDKSGAPVEGVAISAGWYGQGEGTFGGSYQRAAASAADGRYALEDLREGMHTLSATAQGYVTEAKYQINAGTSDVDFTMTRAGRIEGRVVRKSDGGQVEGISVTCRLLSMTAWEQNDVSTASNTFVVDGVGAGKHVVTARAKGFAPGESAEIDVAPEQTVTDVVIELTPGGTLRGTVISAKSRQPIVGAAIVRLAKVGMMEMDADQLLQNATDCKSDADGHFTMENIAPGRHRIRASHEEYASATRTVEISEGHDTEEEFLLGEGARIHGVVTGYGGHPRAGVAVYVTSATWSDPRNTQTDAEGKYEVKGLAAGTYMVMMYEMDAKNASAAKMNTRSAAVKEGESIEVDFSPADGISVHGSVRQGGRAKGNLTMQFISTSGGGSMMNAQTDATGAYSIEGVQPGDYLVEVDSVMLKCTVPSGQRDVRQDFDIPTGTVSGHVYDVRTRAKLQGAQVSVYRPGGEKGGMADFMERFVASGVSDAEGAYSISGLGAGEYIVQVTMQGYAVELTDPFALPAEGNVGGKDFLLTAGASISGVVLDDQRRPVAGARFSLRDLKTRTPLALTELWTTQSDEQGKFTLPGIRAGEYILAAHAEGHASTQRVVRVTPSHDATVELDLPPAGTVRVIARDAAGGPIVNATLALFDAAGNAVESSAGFEDFIDTSRWKTGADGRLERTGIAPGHYRGEVTEGARSATFELDVVAGQAAEANVTLQGR